MDLGNEQSGAEAAFPVTVVFLQALNLQPVCIRTESCGFKKSGIPRNLLVSHPPLTPES